VAAPANRRPADPAGRPYRVLWCSTVLNPPRLTTNDHGTVIIARRV